MEKSDIYNAYKQLSHMTAEAIACKFQSAIAVPKNLKGINIFFVFQPKTREEGKYYSKMLEVYKQLLQSAGAIIHVQANNTEFKV